MQPDHLFVAGEGRGGESFAFCAPSTRLISVDGDRPCRSPQNSHAGREPTQGGRDILHPKRHFQLHHHGGCRSVSEIYFASGEGRAQ